jgi:hypothetical protein
LQRLASDDALRLELSRRARAAYEARWTLERHLGRYIQLIEELRLNKDARRWAGSPPA